MLGAMIKTYYADIIGKKPEEIFVVSIMPCTAKKFECDRFEMNDSGAKDVDVVLEHVLVERPCIENGPRDRRCGGMQQTSTDPIPMPHGQDVVCIHNLGRLREQRCDHTCPDRAVTRRERVAACVRRRGTVQLHQRLPVGTRSRLLASAAPRRHRPEPAARFAMGLTAPSRICTTDH